jgi:hypothetical protein
LEKEGRARGREGGKKVGGEGEKETEKQIGR